jgi:acetylornithine/N-succinyldiaminopimelate aminotransferase
MGKETVGVMIELVQGEAGVVCATTEFVHDLRRLCDAHGALLIFDEVQTGMGRLGKLFGYQYFGVEPGCHHPGQGDWRRSPAGGRIGKGEHACVFESGDHGGTFNGGPLMTAIGQVVVGELLKPGMLHNVVDIGQYLGKSLQQLVAELELEGQGGIGLLRRLDLGADIGREVVVFARDHLRRHAGWENMGILVNSPRPRLLRLMPALNVSTAEIDTLMRGLRVTLNEVRRKR